MGLREIVVRPVRSTEEARFRGLMKQHHYLGALPKIGEKHLARDWELAFGHGVVLLETFVDPARFRGTVYRAANWIEVGHTCGFCRTRRSYNARPQSPKRVFLRPLEARTRQVLCAPTLPPCYRAGESKRTLSAAQMQSLPDLFAEIPDPRHAQGRRHRLRTVLAIAAGAVLCGMRGYHAIADWAQSLGPKARKRFGCRWEKDRYGAPSEYVIRQVLIRVQSADLGRALRRWNQLYAEEDQTLAIDGKTLCNALDEHGHPTHIMSVVGHETKTCYTQKVNNRLALVLEIA